MNSPWFLLQLKPNSHARAILNLGRQGVATFMPCQISQACGASEPVKTPLFPGYLFASFRPETISFKTVNSTYGVSRLVTFGTYVSNGLPPKLIEGLKARCDENGILKPARDLQINDTVRITSGPFAEFIAIVEDLQTEDRVRVLFDLMGQRTKAEIPICDLRRISPGAA